MYKGRWRDESYLQTLGYSMTMVIRRKDVMNAIGAEGVIKFTSFLKKNAERFGKSKFESLYKHILISLYA